MKMYSCWMWLCMSLEREIEIVTRELASQASSFSLTGFALRQRARERMRGEREREKGCCYGCRFSVDKHRSSGQSRISLQFPAAANC